MNGLHLIGDFHHCTGAPALLRDATALAGFCLEACRAAGLSPVGQLFHTFTDGTGAAAGVTGTIVLAESHLCLHTWPESESLTLDLYVCNFSGDNRARARQVFAALRDRFAPSERVCHEVERGTLPPLDRVDERSVRFG
jgi:S-adenosylmethionine decarboxylase proenzyme